MNNILDGLDVVVQYIIIYGPTLIAAITTVTGVVVAVKKLIKGSENAVVETRKLRNEVRNISQAMYNISKENAELKKENAELKRDIHKIYRGN